MRIDLAFCALGLAGVAFASSHLSPATDLSTGTEDCCVVSSTGSRAVYVQAPSAEAVTGKVHGRVVFDGDAPRVSELSISEEGSKGCTEDGSKVSSKALSLLVGEDNGIANGVVTVAVKGQKLIVPETPVVLDQAQCRFDQHVVLVPAGTTVEYTNSDSVVHNVHSLSRRNPGFNRTLTPKNSFKQVLKESEAIQLTCDMHPWMSAYVYVADTNYAALTDEHGAFEIPGLAPGQYTAKVWHEVLGKTEIEFSIDEAGQSEALSIPMKRKQKRSRRQR
jgi:plastocyanin